MDPVGSGQEGLEKAKLAKRSKSPDTLRQRPSESRAQLRSVAR
jgi:hypothetical protein